VGVLGGWLGCGSLALLSLDFFFSGELFLLAVEKRKVQKKKLFFSTAHQDRPPLLPRTSFYLSIILYDNNFSNLTFFS
jgi:hypothetical protein